MYRPPASTKTCQAKLAENIQVLVKNRQRLLVANTTQAIAYTFATPVFRCEHMWRDWIHLFANVSWCEPVILMLGSAAVSSVITIFWISIGSLRTSKRKRHDTAMEIALSLESHARGCRTMMHRATWAVGVPHGPQQSEAARSVMVPVFAYPEKLPWQLLSRRVVSELREYPSSVHAAREYVEAFREFGEATDFCEQVQLECAKAAGLALTLARSTRRRHGAAKWQPGAKDSNLEQELATFISSVEERRKVLLDQRSDYAHFNAQPVNVSTSAQA